ncbi:subtilisin-like protease SBT2.4 [Prosopis cineraria]|uniref:subtilisin-like protease SBT2.4 n=1 Tax=Prosopis cineraria TaxID=364024 RepID=UPI0024106778|nr:subtilisin-like protease SBT2.4 [Prosopis cineraria]
MAGKKKAFQVILATFLVFLFFRACFAEERSIYLVLLEGDAVAFSRVSSHPKSESGMVHANKLVESHEMLLQTTLEKGSYTKLHSFKHILNGFSVHTTPSQAGRLRGIEGVRVVERDGGAKMKTTYTPAFVGVEGMRVWEDGEGGEGVVIGFVDSGINPSHGSFAYDASRPFQSNISKFSGGCETGPRFSESDCNGKIVGARFFSKGAQAIAPLNPSLDFLSPFDADGHGSHVASTAAGNCGVDVVVNGFCYGRACGMAPRARIAVYKAIYPTVGTIADVVAAIDQAVADGVDMISLSVGPEEAPQDTVTMLSVLEISLLFARKAGVLVVQASGNNGPAPSSVLSFSPWTLSVASSSTDRFYSASLLLADGQSFGGVGLSGPGFRNGSVLRKLVLAKDALKVNGTFPRTPEYTEECQHPEALDAETLRGSVIICSFSSGFYNGTSTLTAIVDTAKALSLQGFVLAANPSFGDYIAEPVPFAVPGIMIPSVADSQAILQYYENQTRRCDNGSDTLYGGRAAIGEGRVASFKGRAPVVSRFSSRGPDILDANTKHVADVLKPDILAPGHQIWAAWSPISALQPLLAGQNFGLVSGTSMATPHVAGIAALVKQHNPSWTPSMIASAICTTATRYDNFGEMIMAQGNDINSLYPSTPFDHGAGMINPNSAIDPGLVFPVGHEDYISFLCSLPNIDPANITAATGESCNFSLDYPYNLNLPSVTISSMTGSVSVRRTVMNVANKTETYLGSVLPPNGTTVKLNPSWFTISPQQTQDLEIQFCVTQPMGAFSFGEVVLTGSLNHIVRMTLSVFPVSVL